MKYKESQKITALGVVIFSFIALLLGAVIMIAIDSIAVLLVLKTELPKSFLKIGNILGGGIGLIISTAFMTVKTEMKGIFSALIMTIIVIAIKLLGNHLMQLGGYINFNGLIGILFVILFSLVGGVIGVTIKR